MNISNLQKKNFELNEEQNTRNVAKLLDIFLRTSDKVKK